MNNQSISKSLLERQLTTSSVHDSLATTFFRMEGQNLITFVRFSIRNRTEINNFIKSLDQDKRKPVDLFFICQELNIRDGESRPVYFGAFTYIMGAVELTKKVFETKACEVLNVNPYEINELFELMCRTSFIQISMFERLGKVNPKVWKTTRNPFAQVYLNQDVSLFNNLDKARLFFSQALPECRLKKPETSYQRKFSKLLFGARIKKNIHFSVDDTVTLEKVSAQLKKYEIQEEESQMMDESEEFENVEYRDFDDALEIDEDQELEVLYFLKKTRLASIREIRDRLRDAARRSMRQE